MSSKLGRDQVLREMLNTLIKGWGRKAVYDALDEIVGSSSPSRLSESRDRPPVEAESKILQFAKELPAHGERRELIIKFAQDFVVGTALPKMSDVRAFLASHQQDSKDIKSREQAFRKIAPLLLEMSEKGLVKTISRSQRSGLADLGSISDAIKGAGENLRGGNFETTSDDNKKDKLEPPLPLEKRWGER